ncbi:MAG: 50S ribosomal protein L13 [Candidatus Levybacteria bacterium RIFCSPLOWO2_01_FULL_36_13]|nr:MAG: 50S ribosomal protein L13 [Candidatus Levybacteria bacterium RIFCSPHIGHO2_01_FULL_36_15b]OGH35039.1 MAG: 50S ribosomal protein L13 [Candidatus Levybacteria bacterium RIFCSPLOWO2_01_FULL_36_13]
MKPTKPTKISEVKREWLLIDLEGKILGRAATDIAKLLMGKHKPNFVRNLDMGDNIVVVNAKKVKVTGNKEKLKTYKRHSGYPGGFKEETLSNLRERNPQEIIIKAVSGMLPQNRLKAKMLQRLHVFADAAHSYADKFKTQEKGEVKDGGK